MQFKFQLVAALALVCLASLVHSASVEILERESPLEKRQIGASGPAGVGGLGKPNPYAGVGAGAYPNQYNRGAYNPYAAPCNPYGANPYNQYNPYDPTNPAAAGLNNPLGAGAPGAGGF